eukprot:2454146-Rhodomonas_salina.1
MSACNKETGSVDCICPEGLYGNGEGEVAAGTDNGYAPPRTHTNTRSKQTRCTSLWFAAVLTCGVRLPGATATRGPCGSRSTCCPPRRGTTLRLGSAGTITRN